MEPKKLVRSKKDRMLFGVAGGIAEYFGIDSTIVRLIFVLLTIWGGAGVLLYIIGIFIMPDTKGKDLPNQKARRAQTKKEVEEKVQEVASEIRLKTKGKNYRNEILWGVIILLAGVLFLSRNIFSSLNFGKFWPLILIVAGIFILVETNRKGEK